MVFLRVKGALRRFTNALKRVKKLRRLVGARLLKTGIAVFFVALICEMLEIPVFYPVIAAVVSVELTVAASIRKGMIRFPAAAIGAGYAMLFVFLLGHSPLAYALSVVFTIFTCYRLHWGDAVLVATLTATAMIPDTYDFYVQTFFIRLLGTLLGISVSTAVNFLFLPPRYQPLVRERMAHFTEELASMIERGTELFCHPGHIEALLDDYQLHTLRITEASHYLRSQKEEWTYRQHTRSDLRELLYLQHQLLLFQRIGFHLGNILSLPISLDLTSKEKEQLNVMSREMAGELRNLKPGLFRQATDQDEEHRALRKQRLRKMLMEEQAKQTQLSDKTILLYEMMAIEQLIEELSFQVHRALQSPAKDASNTRAMHQ